MFCEDYGRYILIAKYRDGHWTGYTTCPNSELEELIEKYIHGGLSCRGSAFIAGNVPSQDKYHAQIGFETNLPGDCNIAPDGTVISSFAETEETWDRDSVFAHLKYVIDTAEYIYNHER